MSPSATSCETSQQLEPWASPPEALEAWQQVQEDIFWEVFRPAPHLTPSEWADEHRIVSQGPEAGMRWSMELTPYLVEPLNFLADPWARRGVIRKSARIGYTEGVIGNIIGYTIDQDPCNIAVLQPSDPEARAYSKEQIQPMIERNPRIREKVGQLNSRQSDTTLTYKEFPGGYLLLLGSASDKTLRRRSIRRFLGDEIDAMKVEGAEGDPLMRAQKRTDDFEDGVFLVGSTPTIKNASRIDREFEKSDQRYWHVPCPHCRQYQVLRWGGPNDPFGIKWDREVFCRSCGSEADQDTSKCSDCGGNTFDSHHLPETAYYQCLHCAERIDEGQKAAMIQAGRFIPLNPRSKLPGWHIDALVSLMVGARWSKLVDEWLQAQDDASDLQVFVNTVLGEAWEERSEKVDLTGLEKRTEEFTDARGEVVDVPDGVGVLTAAVDVQGSWLELLVRGWGIGEESWDILHERIHGDPEARNTWARLDGLLAKAYLHASGAELRIMCAMIDAGYATSTVYEFVKPREARNVFAIMGDRTGSPDHVPLKAPRKSNSDGVRVFTVGTFKAKDWLLRSLRIKRPGPRFMHFRTYNQDRCNGFDAEYFAQVESEKKVSRRVRGSREVRRSFVQVRDRNEFFDLHVYNRAAYLALGAGLREKIPEWVQAARMGKTPGVEKKKRRRVRHKGVE